MDSGTLGVVLISPTSICKLCSRGLSVQSDHTRQVILYTDVIGTIPPHTTLNFAIIPGKGARSMGFNGVKAS